MRRLVLTITLVIVFLGMLSVAYRVRIVKAGGTVYIRSDGSIDPPTAPIYRDGDVYTLTGNIYDEIVIEKSNIVIDGSGNMLQGNGSGYGFNLKASLVTVKNANIENFSIGIYLNSSSNNTISGNNITASND